MSFRKLNNGRLNDGLITPKGQEWLNNYDALQPVYYDTRAIPQPTDVIVAPYPKNTDYKELLKKYWYVPAGIGGLILILIINK